MCLLIKYFKIYVFFKICEIKNVLFYSGYLKRYTLHTFNQN